MDWYYFAMVVYFYSGHWWIFTPALTYGMRMNDNPTEIADHLENEHGICAALAIVGEGKYDANRDGDN